MSRKKYLRAIYEDGKSLEFIEFLLKKRSIVIEDYAKVFCSKYHIKALTAEEEQLLLAESIRLAHVNWLAKD